MWLPSRAAERLQTIASVWVGTNLLSLFAAKETRLDPGGFSPSA
jgi:hypothetical protein